MMYKNRVLGDLSRFITELESIIVSFNNKSVDAGDVYNKLTAMSESVELTRMMVERENYRVKCREKLLSEFVSAKSLIDTSVLGMNKHAIKPTEVYNRAVNLHRTFGALRTLVTQEDIRR